MIYTMQKPSAAMLLSQHEINEMTHQQEIDLYNAEQEKIHREQAAEERERNAYMESMRDRMISRESKAMNRAKYLQNVKTAMLAECLMKVYTESYATPMTKRDRVIGRNLINSFITENGVGNLLGDFATKNIVLSEFSRLVNKYYNRVLESDACPEEYGCGDVKELNLDTTTVEDFYKDLVEVDTTAACKLIKDRVSDAISNFMDSNIENKLEYQEVIQAAQDRINSIKPEDDTEGLAESYAMNAKSTVNTMKLNRPKGIFHCMTEAMAKSVFKDDALQARYIHEGKVDMDRVVDSVQSLYHMLEMCNTLEIIDVNESYIKEYIDSLAK